MLGLKFVFRCIYEKWMLRIRMSRKLKKRGIGRFRLSSGDLSRKEVLEVPGRFRPGSGEPGLSMVCTLYRVLRKAPAMVW